MRDENLDPELPEWTFRGGYFRPGFSTNDMPKAWSRRNGKWRWQREEMVPFGKASQEYRRAYFTCPYCKDKQLKPSAEDYTFVCEECGVQFGWSFGSLYEKEDENRYTPEDY